MKNKSYFSPFHGSPLASWLHRLLHPYKRTISCILNQNKINILLTKRANQALSRRVSVMTIEMQLYFSCMVKKRVLFHTGSVSFPFEQIIPGLNIAFRSVQSDNCDPEEFAAHFPQKKSLNNSAINNMTPRVLCIDYIDDSWVGDFTIGKAESNQSYH